MPAYRSRRTTEGALNIGARALWRATGLTDEDFGRPIVAVVNSFVEFVPGHVHLRDLGRLRGGAERGRRLIGPRLTLSGRPWILQRTMKPRPEMSLDRRRWWRRS